MNRDVHKVRGVITHGAYQVQVQPSIAVMHTYQPCQALKAL
jgi:hypothetical protein